MKNYKKVFPFFVKKVSFLARCDERLLLLLLTRCLGRVRHSLPEFKEWCNLRRPKPQIYWVQVCSVLGTVKVQRSVGSRAEKKFGGKFGSILAYKYLIKGCNLILFDRGCA